MEKLEIARKGKVAYKTNPEYSKFANKNIRLGNKITKLMEEGKDTKALRKEYVLNIRKRNKIKSTQHNPEYTKISYVRYADD